MPRLAAVCVGTELRSPAAVSQVDNAPASALAPWACHASRSRGRRHPEPPPHARSAHERDRDRIVHCSAFRRLVYKTQVFINHEGDLFRTRLTHSLEVAQLGRSMARRLRLDEDLVEAIALAHDLGHTPFGHAGQEALDACMARWGGFEHNLQSLRVVDRLEQRYPAFDGLNLSFEAREGILKRCPRAQALRLEREEPGGVGRRFLDGSQPSLEAQLVNLADEMAYNAHDLDDGVRAGLLQVDRLRTQAPFSRFMDEALRLHPALEGQPRRWLAEALRRMLSAQVEDVLSHSSGRLAELKPADADAVRTMGREHGALIAASPAMGRDTVALKRLLFAALYRHPQVVDSTDRARRVIKDLFDAYLASPNELPADHAAAQERPRALADYIAGMTDRFALREHHRLTGHRVFDRPGG